MQVVPLAQVGQLAMHQPELVVFVLPPDPERALGVLGNVRLLAQARVLAVGPATDSKLILRALRTGADDYIDVLDLEGDLEAAVQRLTPGTTMQASPGVTIALLAPSGGSGSSTLAVNLATVLAQHHKQSVLFDLKLETGDGAALLDLKPTHTLADLCQNAARMDRIMFQRSLVRHASGVHLLAPPRMLADIGYVTAEGVLKALALARALFPYVVVDLDHSFREEQVQAIRQADTILVILRLDFASLRNTQRTLEHLAQKGIGPERVRVVVNRYGQPKEVPVAKAEEALSVKVFHYIPEDARTINRANNNGVPAVLEYPSAKVCKSIIGLAASVNGRHKAH
jgi:pilus assembly protein CpaE